MKFSDLVTTAGAADETVKADQAKLAADSAAGGAAHSAVVAALHSKTPPRVDLVQADGTVNEITLNADGTDFVVTNVPGDFDVA